jgi:phosphatidylglycerol:prolipoprotein diacylglycerol transferase
MLAIAFPAIDPVAIAVGPLTIRWYALAYVAGILLGWRFGLYLCRKNPEKLTPQQLDDLVLWITLGIILGGRVGYVLFYKPAYFLANPAEIAMLWQGGMSFHGGMLGVFLAIWIYTRRQGVRFFVATDVIGMCIPFGLCFGRIANFINGELYGRTTDVPWGVIFPGTDGTPRHPSQLYEAGLEGVALLLLLYVAWRLGAQRHVGLLSGLFMVGYGCARSVVELARQPDAHLGFLWGGFTMGQFLSLPMIAVGLYLLWWSQRPQQRA